MRTIAIVLAISLLAAGGAWAQKNVANPVGDKAPDRIDCQTDGYDCYCGGSGGDIPDADPAGAIFGPANTSNGGPMIVDVILFVEITHTWIGDLQMFLYYDFECDGVPDVIGQVLERPGVPGTTFGCSGDLAGLYGFDDTVASIEDICPTIFPTGCYGPDYDSVGMDVFDGLPIGGCFWLHVIDNAGGDVGSVTGWEVCVMTQITPVEEATWGHVKALYR